MHHSDRTTTLRTPTRLSFQLALGVCATLLVGQLCYASIGGGEPPAITASWFAVGACLSMLGGSMALAGWRTSRETAMLEPVDAPRESVYRAHRLTQGVRAQMMNREDFMYALSDELNSDSTKAPLSLIAVRLVLETDDAELMKTLRHETSGTILSSVQPGQMAGYLGAGLFAIALPETSPADGHEPWLRLRDEAADVAGDYNALIHETFVTSDRGERIESLYGRTLYSLREYQADSLRATVSSSPSR
jgi:hypothetical protein